MGPSTSASQTTTPAGSAGSMSRPRGGFGIGGLGGRIRHESFLVAPAVAVAARADTAAGGRLRQKRRPERMCDTITGGMDQREVAGRAAVRASAPFPLLARLLFWYVA